MSARRLGAVACSLMVDERRGSVTSSRVPANAVAVTGNLTVTGPTQGGYVSMTQLTTNTPSTSTLNFPRSDTRANGVTGPLSGSGTVGLVERG